jgi:hypothetical protein
VQEAAITDPSSFSPKILYPEWQPAYLAALLELDRKTLFERVTAERQAIEDALASLRVLKRDELGFPDWGKR